MLRRTNDYIKITNIKVFAYHGVYEEERKHGQDFYLNAKVYYDMKKACTTGKLEDALDYSEICSNMVDLFTEKSFRLIEKAAEYVIQELMCYFKQIQAIELEVCKPNAPMKYQPENISVTVYREWHKVYVSFGTNFENPLGHINETLYYLKDNDNLCNIKRSNLMRTKPYGPVKQNDFINGCLVLDTMYTPDELMEYFRGIEDYFERDRSIKWGPRPIDLDILFYDGEVYSSNLVSIPHYDMQNRMFVLAPLAELCPNFRHPVLGKTVAQMKQELEEKQGMDEILEVLEWDRHNEK